LLLGSDKANEKEVGDLSKQIIGAPCFSESLKATLLMWS
jgi:hypothetical protein